MGKEREIKILQSLKALQQIQDRLIKGIDYMQKNNIIDDSRIQVELTNMKNSFDNILYIIENFNGKIVKID